MCSHRGRNGFSPQGSCSITHLLSRPKVSKSHCLISQEPFLRSVRTLSTKKNGAWASAPRCKAFLPKQLIFVSVGCHLGRGGEVLSTCPGLSFCDAASTLVKTKRGIFQPAKRSEDLRLPGKSFTWGEQGNLSPTETPVLPEQESATWRRRKLCRRLGASCAASRVRPRLTLPFSSQ